MKKNYKQISFSFLAVLLIWANIHPQSIAKNLNDYFSQIYQNDQLNRIVLVAERKKTIYQQSFSLANFENNMVVQKSELDIPYVENGSHKQQLDLYLPDKKDFATVLFVHGGSLQDGDRKENPYPQIGEAFQKAGIACAVISYRLGNEAKWAAQPQDVVSAFAWLKKNIKSRGGDEKRIYLVGHSSGGLLVALVSTDETYLKEKSLSFKDVAGSVPMGTLFEDPLNVDRMSPEAQQNLLKNDSYFKIFGSIEAFKKSWAIENVNPQMPPILVLIAEEERFQPPILASTEKFVEAAKKVGVIVSYDILPNRTHLQTILKMPETNDPTLLRILKFIEKGK